MVKTIDFKKVNEEVLKGRYYNGGWVKKVTGLDKSHQNGFSFQGSFVAKEGSFIYSDGLYLICDIDGSRNNQKKSYALLKIKNNEYTLLQTEENVGKDWAIKFWDIIENNLFNPNTLEVLKNKAKQKIDIMSEEELKVFLGDF